MLIVIYRQVIQVYMTQ